MANDSISEPTKVKQELVHEVAVVTPILTITGLVIFFTGAWFLPLVLGSVAWMLEKKIESVFEKEIRNAKKKLFGFFDAVFDRIERVWAGRSEQSIFSCKVDNTIPRITQMDIENSTTTSRVFIPRLGTPLAKTHFGSQSVRNSSSQSPAEYKRGDDEHRAESPEIENFNNRRLPQHSDMSVSAPRPDSKRINNESSTQFLEAYSHRENKYGGISSRAERFNGRRLRHEDVSVATTYPESKKEDDESGQLLGKYERKHDKSSAACRPL